MLRPGRGGRRACAAWRCRRIGVGVAVVGHRDAAGGGGTWCVHVSGLGVGLGTEHKDGAGFRVWFKRKPNAADPIEARRWLSTRAGQARCG